MDLTKLKATGAYILARLEEPSTFAGAGVGAVLVHMIIPGGIGDKIVAIAGAVFAFLAFALPQPHANPTLKTRGDADLRHDAVLTTKDLPLPITETVAK